MSNKNNNMAGLLYLIAQFVIIFGGGYKAWSWCEPSSFIGVLVFLAVWGVLVGVGELLLTLLIEAITK